MFKAALMTTPATPTKSAYLIRAIELLQHEFGRWGDSEIDVEVEFNDEPYASALKHALEGKLYEKVETALYEIHSEAMADERHAILEICTKQVMTKLDIEFGDDENYDSDVVESQLDDAINNYEVGDEPSVNLDISGHTHVVLNFTSNKDDYNSWASKMLMLCSTANLPHFPILEYAAFDGNINTYKLTTALLENLQPKDFLANAALFAAPSIEFDVDDEDAEAPVISYKDHIKEQTISAMRFIELLDYEPGYDFGLAFSLSWQDLEAINQAAIDEKPFHLKAKQLGLFAIDFINGAGDYFVANSEMTIPMDLLKNPDIDVSDDRAYRYGIQKIHGDFPSSYVSVAEGNPMPAADHLYSEAMYQYQLVYHSINGNYGALADVWEARGVEKSLLPGMVQGESLGAVSLMHYAALIPDASDSIDMCRFLAEQGVQQNDILPTADCYPIDLALAVHAQARAVNELMDEDPSAAERVLSDFYEIGATRMREGEIMDIIPEALAASIVAQHAARQNIEHQPKQRTKLRM
ncbi:hypothetical protein ACKF11_13020 [Methylobacillus sp. Pita2]|uniref:hypothetical protein n=1 Tax=Methylobacillus sp. Pita2 TaxID=3383245 RepID=UPI0038B4B9C6